MHFWGAVQPSVTVQFKFSGTPEGGWMSDVVGSAKWIGLGGSLCVVLGIVSWVTSGIV